MIFLFQIEPNLKQSLPYFPRLKPLTALGLDTLNLPFG